MAVPGRPRRKVAAPAGVGAAVLACAALLAAEPTPTPTPRPRLSGGFGRTPVAAPEPADQSMSDAVRAASEARARKEQKTPVAINNKTLVTDPTKGRLSTASPPPATATPRAGSRASGTPPAAITPTPTSAASAPTPSSDEAQWRERARAARQRVADGRARVAQLETETKKLENDFYSWDDGQYRDGVIKPAWDRKRADLEAARRELDEAEKDLADLPEQARKAGALPGWIRE